MSPARRGVCRLPRSGESRPPALADRALGGCVSRHRRGHDGFPKTRPRWALCAEGAEDALPSCHRLRPVQALLGYLLECEALAEGVSDFGECSVKRILRDVPEPISRGLLILFSV